VEDLRPRSQIVIAREVNVLRNQLVRNHVPIILVASLTRTHRVTADQGRGGGRSIVVRVGV
jgi:hypothetical protein